MSAKMAKFCYALILFFGLAFLLPTGGAQAAQAATGTPGAIIVLPPVNKSTKAGAENFFGQIIKEPVLYIGYQALPREMTSQSLLSQGIVNTEALDDLNMKKFQTLLGADAVMFTTITDWKAVSDNEDKLELKVNYVLRDSATGKKLWSSNDVVTVDLNDRFYAGKLGILSQVLLTGANGMTVSVFDKPLQDYTVTLNYMPVTSPNALVK